MQEQALNAPQLRLVVCSPTTSCTCPVERLLQTIVRVVGYTWGWCEGEQDGAENGMFAKAHTGVGVYLFGGRGVLGPSSQRHPKGWGCPTFQKGCMYQAIHPPAVRENVHLCIRSITRYYRFRNSLTTSYLAPLTPAFLYVLAIYSQVYLRQELLKIYDCLLQMS